VRPRVGSVIVCCVLLGACTGGARTGTLTSPSASTSIKRPPRVTREAPPPAQMQVGTDFQLGVLIRYCEGSRCDQDAAARPTTSAQATTDGLVLFVLKRVPASARVDFLKVSNLRSVMHKALHTGSLTLAVHEDLAPGAYIVRLSVAWRGHEAIWLFGLKVARARA